MLVVFPFLRATTSSFVLLLFLLLLTVDPRPASPSTLTHPPRTIDQGGLFVDDHDHDDQCPLKADPGGSGGGTSSYMEWVVNQRGWLKRQCPPGTRFEPTACRCLAAAAAAAATAFDDKGLVTHGSSNPPKPVEDQTPGLSTEPSVNIEPFMCALKAATERGFYLEQVEGHGLLTRRCPEGTDFNAKLCVCATTSESSSVRSEMMAEYHHQGQGHHINYEDQNTSEASLTKSEMMVEYQDQDQDEGHHINYEDQNNVVVNTTPERPAEEIVNEKEVPASQFPCNKKEAEEETNSYMELVPAHGWVTRPCPVGTVFIQTECECLIEGWAPFDSKGERNAIKQSVKVENEKTGSSDSRNAGSDVLPKNEINADQNADSKRGMGETTGSGAKRNPGSDAREITGSESAETSAREDEQKHENEAEQEAGSDSKEATGSESDETARWEGQQEVGNKAEPKPTSGRDNNQIAGSELEGAIGRGIKSQKNPERDAKGAGGDNNNNNNRAQVIQGTQSDYDVQESQNMPDPETRNAPDPKKPAASTESRLKKVLDGRPFSGKKDGSQCKKIADFDPGFYLLLIPGDNWVRLACPGDTVFRPSQCQCVLQASPPLTPSVFAPGLVSGETTTTTTTSVAVPSEEVDKSMATPTATASATACNMKADDSAPDRYLERVQGYGWISRPCPDQTTFDPASCLCIFGGPRLLAGATQQGTTPGQKLELVQTDRPCQRKPGRTPNHYFQMAPDGSRLPVLVECPHGTIYNAPSCECSLPTNDGGSRKRINEDNQRAAITPTPKQPSWGWTDANEESFCNKRPTGDATRYQELVPGFGWMDRGCPKGTTFDPTGCICSSASLAENRNTNKAIGTSSSSSPTMATRTSRVEEQEERTKQNHFDSFIELVRKLNPAHQSGRGPTRTHTPTKALCLRKPTTVNPNVYLELTSDFEWVAKLCPRETRFLPEHCQCLPPPRLYARAHPHPADRETGAYGMGGLGRPTYTHNLTPYQKMLASKIFVRWDNLPLGMAPGRV